MLITLGLFLIINAVAGDIWNYQVRILTNPFGKFPDWVPSVGGDRYVEVLGSRLKYQLVSGHPRIGTVPARLDP